MHLRTVLFACLVTIPGCGPEAETVVPGTLPSKGAPDPVAETKAAELLGLTHDFGIVPHGQIRKHEFDLDLHKLAAGTGETLVPLRVHLECSCGHADVRLRKADGSDRFIDGTGMPHNLPADGERALLHVELDTTKREAVDIEKTVSRGFVVLQPQSDQTGQARVRVPFLIHFGIDAPVELRPFAMLDFGRIPVSGIGQALTTIRGDEAHRELTFWKLRTTDPNLTAWLEAGPERTTLRARCKPADLGNHRAAIVIDTDLDGYQLVIEATWKVIGDIEALPIAKVSFRCQLGDAQTESDRQRQFVLVEDHNTSRTPEFAVHSVVWDDGRDASKLFEVTIEPVAGQKRQQRVFVRYVGGLDGTFRGTIILGKPGPPEAPGPQLPIDLVVIPSRQP